MYLLARLGRAQKLKPEQNPGIAQCRLHVYLYLMEMIPLAVA